MDRYQHAAGPTLHGPGGRLRSSDFPDPWFYKWDPQHGGGMLLDPLCTALGADYVRAISQIHGSTNGTPSMGAARGISFVQTASQTLSVFLCLCVFPMAWALFYFQK